MSEYICIYDIRQYSEYVSNNTQCEVTLQINEYLLRDRRIQNSIKDIRQSALEK